MYGDANSELFSSMHGIITAPVIVVVEDNLVANGNKIDFYHHGKIAVGNMGSGKVDELRIFVADRYPKIIQGNKFYLGTVQC